MFSVIKEYEYILEINNPFQQSTQSIQSFFNPMDTLISYISESNIPAKKGFCKISLNQEKVLITYL